MKKIKSFSLIPVYLKKFSCKGSLCEDTCCNGWHVAIDKKTYKNYKKLKNSELQPLLVNSITRNNKNSNVQNYAKMNMNPEGYCPLMTKEKLCGIHNILGEDYLSNVCATYPRISHLFNGVIEYSGTLSCPEVARLVLLNPQGIDFEYLSKDVNEKTIINKRIDVRQVDLNNPFKELWEIRSFTISILQNRNYNIYDRLILLGIFIKKVQECINEEKSEKILDCITLYNNLINKGELREQLLNIPSVLNIQIKLLKELIDERFITNIGDRYFDVFRDFLVGLKCFEDTTDEEMVTNYKEAYKKFYKPFMKDYEYILENYLVNYVFKIIFPFNLDGKVFDEFIKLVLHFSLIKLLLIGVAGNYREDFNTDIIIKVIQTFSREIEHNYFYINYILDLLKKNEVNELSHLSILIKN